MGIDCYYHPFSSPSRGVLLAAKNLGVQINLKLTNIFAGDQYKPEYLKMNPNHAVPTMDDNGFYVYDSRACIQYLANAYEKGDSLYPKDPKKRWVVDQKLFLDVDTYQAFANVFYPPAFFKEKVNPAMVKKLDEALEKVNKILQGNKYIAGERMSIADFCTAATLSTIEACGHDTETKYPGIKRYMALARSEILGWVELNQQGADQYGEFIQNAVRKAQSES